MNYLIIPDAAEGEGMTADIDKTLADMVADLRFEITDDYAYAREHIAQRLETARVCIVPWVFINERKARHER